MTVIAILRTRLVGIMMTPLHVTCCLVIKNILRTLKHILKASQNIDTEISPPNMECKSSSCSSSRQPGILQTIKRRFLARKATATRTPRRIKAWIASQYPAAHLIYPQHTPLKSPTVLTKSSLNLMRSRQGQCRRYTSAPCLPQLLERSINLGVVVGVGAGAKRAMGTEEQRLILGGVEIMRIMVVGWWLVGSIWGVLRELGVMTVEKSMRTRLQMMIKMGVMERSRKGCQGMKGTRLSDGFCGDFGMYLVRLFRSL